MPNKFDLDIAAIRKLANLLEETGLSEIEYAEGDRKIRCVSSHGQAIQAAVPAALPSATAEKTEAPPKGMPIPSPMVGTVYLAATPGQPAFIKVGDKVKEGDTLLIIEAMKVMNPIKAPTNGKISQILVEDASPVEFGETLVIIE